jgi:hypothetical protein
LICSLRYRTKRISRSDVIAMTSSTVIGQYFVNSSLSAVLRLPEGAIGFAVS